MPAVLCAYCAATMKLSWTLASKQPTLQLRFECCDHGLYIICSVAGIIFASPFKFSHDMRCRNIFTYLGPIATSDWFSFRWLFGAAAAVGTHVRLMPSGYACSCCAFRVLRPWSSYAGTLASKRPHFTIERVACCDRGVYIGRTVAGITFCWFFIFLPRGGVSKNCLGRQFGIWCRSSGGKQTWYAEGLCSSVLCFSRVATMKILCWDVGPPRGRILQLRGLNVATMAFTQYVLLQESFFVVLHFYFCHGMATAEIQPQEMRIWGLGWRNCSREFSGTWAPLFGRSRPPKNPSTGNENPCELVLGGFQGLASPYLAAPGHQKIQPQEMRISAWQNFPRFPQGLFHYLGLQAEELWAKIWHGFPCFVDCENWEEQLSNFWRTTKKWIHCSFFIAVKKLLSCSPFFSMYRDLLPL